MRPGLYVATVLGVEGVMVWGPDQDGDWHVLEPGNVYDRNLAQFVGEKSITDARPLVVLDPDSDDDCRRLMEAALAHRSATIPTLETIRGILRALADPKPPEPTGLGAVVRLGDGRTAVRAHATSEHPWVISDEPGRWSWRGLVEKVGLPEGWSA